MDGLDCAIVDVRPGRFTLRITLLAHRTHRRCGRKSCRCSTSARWQRCAGFTWLWGRCSPAWPARPSGRRRDGLRTGLERMMRTGFANRVLPLDSGAACACRDRRRTVADGAADHTSRLSDRGHCLLTRYGGGNAQHSELRGHGNRHIQPMGRRMSRTTEPRDSLAGSSRRCSRSMGASSCAILQPHWIGGLDALQELTQSGGVPV